MILVMIGAAMALDASCFTGANLRPNRGKDSDLNMNGDYTNDCGQTIVGTLGTFEIRSKGGVKSATIHMLASDMGFATGLHGWGPHIELPRKEVAHRVWFDGEPSPMGVADYGWLLVAPEESLTATWSTLEVYLVDGAVLTRQ